MYNLVYLPSAQQDMLDIVHYISQTLGNPIAATNIANTLISDIERLYEHPYAYPSYTPLQPLEHDYRKFVIDNYIVFYWVDEASHSVVIARVVYARRNLTNIF